MSSLLSAPPLMVPVYLCSSRSNAGGALRAIQSAQKAIQGSKKETRELLLGGTEEKSISLMRGHFFTKQATLIFDCLRPLFTI